MSNGSRRDPATARRRAALSTSLRREGSGRSESVPQRKRSTSRGSTIPRLTSTFAAATRPWRADSSRTASGSGARRIPSRFPAPFNSPPRSPLHFGHLLAAPEDEHRARDEDGRGAADQEADHQRQREVVQHLPAA